MPGRKVAIVARRYSPVTSSIRPRWACARPKTRSVGSPLTTSWKWWARVARARQRCAAWRPVAMPIRAPKSGTSGSVQATMIPEIGSATVIVTSTASGIATALMSVGR